MKKLALILIACAFAGCGDSGEATHDLLKDAYQSLHRVDDSSARIAMALESIDKKMKMNKSEEPNWAPLRSEALYTGAEIIHDSFPPDSLPNVRTKK